MYEFCQHEYSFKLACLWRKLEFYTRVQRKICIFCCSLNPLNQDTYIWSHHNHTFASCSRSGIIVWFFHETIFFFLISTLHLVKHNSVMVSLPWLVECSWNSKNYFQQFNAINSTLLLSLIHSSLVLPFLYPLDMSENWFSSLF